MKVEEDQEEAADRGQARAGIGCSTKEHGLCSGAVECHWGCK